MPVVSIVVSLKQTASVNLDSSENAGVKRDGKEDTEVCTGESTAEMRFAIRSFGLQNMIAKNLYLLLRRSTRKEIRSS